MENKYFFVSYIKEVLDTNRLIDKIKEDGWISTNTVLVNCSPDYSSRVVQMLSHKLSYKNQDQVYETINLEMPYPNMSQVWNDNDKSYQKFDKYLSDWTRFNINSNFDYLFIDSGTLRGKNFTTVRNFIKPRLEPSQFRFASLYVQDTSIFTPDYYVEKFNMEKQGGLLFEWENVNNPNWNY